MSPTEQEIRARLVRDEWMLRDVDTAFEGVPRVRPDNLLRVCKLCDERVPLWQREKHLRRHQRTRETIRRQAKAKADAAKLRNLDKGRATRARS